MIENSRQRYNIQALFPARLFGNGYYTLAEDSLRQPEEGKAR